MMQTECAATDGGGEVLIQVDREAESLVRLTFREDINRVRTSFDVVDGVPEVTFSYCQ